MAYSLMLVAELSLKVAELGVRAYVSWYTRMNIPKRGDLVVNNRDLWIDGSNEPFFRPYSFPDSRVVPEGTPMICMGPGMFDPPSYVLRLVDVDATLPERMVVHIKIVSRHGSARG